MKQEPKLQKPMRAGSLRKPAPNPIELLDDRGRPTGIFRHQHIPGMPHPGYFTLDPETKSPREFPYPFTASIPFTLR